MGNLRLNLSLMFNHLGELMPSFISADNPIDWYGLNWFEGVPCINLYQIGAALDWILAVCLPPSNLWMLDFTFLYCA